jgi:hypothetical protein
LQCACANLFRQVADPVSAGFVAGSRDAPTSREIVLTLMLDLNDYPLLVVFAVGLGVVLTLSEIGWQLGVRAEGRGSSNLTTLESAMLGLLALMIAFTFSMALSRFDLRRDALLNEANAIGTTALRARLLPEPHRTETLKLLQEYVQIRLDIARSGTSLVEQMTAVARSNALQESLWQQAKTMAAKDKGLIPTGLFIQALNVMIDDQEKRLAALRSRIPNSVLLALFGIAAVAGAFAGYASGLEEKRSRVPVYLMGLVVSAVIFIILDLDRPSAGFITNNQQPMIDTAATIAAFPELK